MVDSEDFKADFQSAKELCQSARTAGISEEEAPTLGSIPISLCDLLSSAGLDWL